MGRAFPYKSFQVRPAENKQRPLRMSHYRSANMIRPSRRTGRDIAEPAPVPLPLEDARHHDVAGSPLHSRRLGLFFFMEPTSYPRLPPSNKCSFEGGGLEGRAIGGCTFSPRGRQPSKAKVRHPWVPKLRCVGLLAPGFEVHPAMARVGPGLQQLTWPDVLPVRSSLRGLLLRSETPSRIVWNPGWPPGWACPAFGLSGGRCQLLVLREVETTASSGVAALPRRF